MSKKLCFLGGTCGKNDWRLSFISALIAAGVSADSLFNPVVADWNEQAQANEERAKAEATHMLFYLADPKDGAAPAMSTYSAVEATMALYDKPDTTVVVFDETGLTGHALKALNQTKRVFRKRFPNALIFDNAQAAIDWLSQTLV